MQIQSPAARVSRRLDRFLPTLLTLFLGLAFCAVMTAPARADDATRAAALVQSATNSVQNFLTNPKWQAVRNLLGGARAIFIVPMTSRADFC
jgi:hypothetical protein